MYCSNIGKKSISTIVKKKLIKRDTLTICQKKLLYRYTAGKSLLSQPLTYSLKASRGKSTHKHNKYNVNKYTFFFIHEVQ